MDLLYTLGVLCLSVVVRIDVVTTLSDGQASPRGPHEYCSGERFKPRCYHPQEVVVITQAEHGLQSHGRCLTIDTSKVGCSVNVIGYVAGLCSGRRSCEFVVDSKLDELATSCSSPGFPFYLNATYRCDRVEGDEACSTCQSLGSSRVTSSELGLLGSIVTSETNECGSSQCPWSIEVRPGQVINLTLFDYGPLNNSQRTRVLSSLSYPSSSESQCTGPRYALIKERANPRETMVCATNQNGQRHIYTSISNNLEVHIISREVLDWSVQFIILYEAVGCSDVTPPRHTWMRRTDDRVEVGCPTTGARWHLTCVNGQWQGEMGKTCPGVPGVSIPGELHAAPSTTPSSTFWSAFPMTVLIAAVVAVACIIGVLILTTGIVCIKRHQFKKRHPPSRPSSIYARATSEFEFRGGPESTPMMASSRQRGVSKTRLSVGRQYPDGVVVYDPQQAQPVRHMIGSRPLPSIPGAGSAERHPHPMQTTVQLHPTGSMQSACTCHSHFRGTFVSGPPSLAPKVRSIGTGPTADGNWGGGDTALYGNATLPYTDDQHHYFVLDPDAVQDRPPSPASSQHNATITTAESDSALRFPTPPPPLPEAELTTKTTVVARRQSPDGKERDEARDTVDELNKNRCSVHEIPLRPSRDGQSQGKAVTTGEAVDMGTSSWP